MSRLLFISCSVCFGDPSSLQSKSIAYGVFFLLGVVVSVLVAIAYTAFAWSRRAKTLSR